MKLLAQMPSLVKGKAKRVGRGYGSGKGGHTVGRGTKGQGAREKQAIWFEGGQLPTIRRFPFIRGKSRLKPLSLKSRVLSVDRLAQLAPGTEVSLKTLVAAKLIPVSKRDSGSVKIVAGKELKVPLKVKVPCSEAAIKQIEQAGGSVSRE